MLVICNKQFTESGGIDEDILPMRGGKINKKINNFINGKDYLYNTMYKDLVTLGYLAQIILNSGPLIYFKLSYLISCLKNTLIMFTFLATLYYTAKIIYLSLTSTFMFFEVFSTSIALYVLIDLFKYNSNFNEFNSTVFPFILVNAAGTNLLLVILSLNYINGLYISTIHNGDLKKLPTYYMSYKYFTIGFILFKVPIYTNLNTHTLPILTLTQICTMPYIFLNATFPAKIKPNLQYIVLLSSILSIPALNSITNIKSLIMVTTGWTSMSTTLVILN